MKCWSWLTPPHVNPLCTPLPSSMFSDISLIYYSGPWWEYVHHGNWQTVQITQHITVPRLNTERIQASRILFFFFFFLIQDSLSPFSTQGKPCSAQRIEGQATRFVTEQQLLTLNAVCSKAPQVRWHSDVTKGNIS